MDGRSIFTVCSNVLTIGSHKSSELDDFMKCELFETNIKSQIANGNINEIINYSKNLKLFNEFNFQSSNIKKFKCHNLYDANLNDVENVNFTHLLNSLPESLEELDLLNTAFSIQNINNLPPNLKILKIKCINLELDNLPNKLESLHIITDGIVCLEYLPSSLENLIINFNKNISDCNLDLLPSSLKNLEIYGMYMNQLNNLPPRLKKLYIPNKYDLEIFNLPIGITELKIGIQYKFLGNIFSNSFNVDKYNLKILKIGYQYKSYSLSVSNFDLTSIPQTVEHIEFVDEFNQRITWLPPNLKYLSFGFNFRHDVNSYHDLPDSIETLIFGYNFNSQIYKYPTNLKYLEFGRNYSRCITNLPISLVHLVINERFHDKIHLPKNLKILEFDESTEFTGNLILPDSIEKLVLGKYYKSSIDKIPVNLKEIKLSQSNELVKTKLFESGFTGIINYYPTNTLLD